MLPFTDTVIVRDIWQHVHLHFVTDELEDKDVPFTRTHLEEILTKHVVYLLLHRMEVLLQILYRIDVNEAKVKTAFAQSDPKQIAPQLVSLIIDREWQKSVSRMKYKQS